MVKKKTKLPDPIWKRALLFSDAGDGKDLPALAEGFLESGNMHDAIAFFARAGRTDRLEVLASRAVEQGDFPSLFSIAEAGIEITAKTWRRCGEAGKKLGKMRYAAEAFRRAGDEKTAKELEDESERQSYSGMRSAKEADAEDGEKAPDAKNDKPFEFDAEPNA
ncbi:MAG: hypothetical protein E3J72_15105 [Planctomycetota bacterium]|nr:MAG: hypothetical protein E3J72_15105 [Planctomycetota bacterium]